MTSLFCSRGANPYDSDSKGFTSLHFAIQAERVENVEILLQLLQDSKFPHDDAHLLKMMK